VDGRRGAPGLGRAAPHGDAAVDAALALEAGDVLHELLGELHLAGAGLHVGPSSFFTYPRVEDRLHGAHRLEEVLHQARGARWRARRPWRPRCTRRRGRVPGAELQAGERGQRDEIGDARRAVVGALAEADGAHLRERPDGLGDPPADHLDPGDEGGGDGAEAGEQDAELALDGREGRGGLHGRARDPRSGTVLVVDDEKNIRRTLRMVLEGDGLEVRDAERAEDALAVLAEEPVDVLVTDIRLPGMSGIELLERVKRAPEWAGIPVVVISGHALGHRGGRRDQARGGGLLREAPRPRPRAGERAQRAARPRGWSAR
jgi:CheY-like chemotaxis protein